MPGESYEEWKGYKLAKRWLHFAVGIFLATSIVLASTALFIYIATDANTNDVQVATDKTEGGHHAWDWIHLAFVIALLGEIVVLVIDFTSVNTVEYHARREGCNKKSNRAKHWMIGFLIIYCLFLAFTISVWVHALIRRNGDENVIANTFYDMIIAATTIAALTQAFAIGMWSWSVNNVNEACAPTHTGENAQLISGPNSSGKKPRKMVNGQAMFKRQ